MVDEIIIHDVDVSSCKYLPYCEDKQGNCGNNPDCYFKQLARKTAECEELKEENEELTQRNAFLLQRLEVDDNDTSLVFKLQNELRQKSNEFYQAIKSNVKYEQALDEIENIIKDLENKNILTFPDLSKEENYNMIMKQCNSGYVQILNIIAKAKGN